MDPLNLQGLTWRYLSIGESCWLAASQFEYFLCRCLMDPSICSIRISSNQQIVPVSHLTVSKVNAAEGSCLMVRNHQSIGGHLAECTQSCLPNISQSLRMHAQRAAMNQLATVQTERQAVHRNKAHHSACYKCPNVNTGQESYHPAGKNLSADRRGLSHAPHHASCNAHKPGGFNKMQKWAWLDCRAELPSQGFDSRASIKSHM